MRTSKIEDVNFSFFQSWNEFDQIIQAILSEKATNMIFACDSRALLESRTNHDLKNAYQFAKITVADGKPIFWCGKRHNEVHITGPKIMDFILESDVLKAKRHFFIGGPKRTVVDIVDYSNKLGVKVVGDYTPPFSNLDQYNWEEIELIIRESNPDFIWVGLGAPKQELFAFRLSKITHSSIILGVGLAFDYKCGNVKRPPNFISKLGFEWLWRYSQQPKRIGRFVRPLFYAISLLIKRFLIRKIIG